MPLVAAIYTHPAVRDPTINHELDPEIRDDSYLLGPAVMNNDRCRPILLHSLGQDLSALPEHFRQVLQERKSGGGVEWVGGRGAVRRESESESESEREREREQARECHGARDILLERVHMYNLSLSLSL